MERLRVGVIGCGAIAQMMHLPYLRELDDRFAIAALCDRDPVALEEVGRQYGVTRLFATAGELLEEPLDAVFILTSGDHAPATEAALERGLHVFVEKPLTYTLRQTDGVLAAAARSGKTLMVGMMKQYDPGYRRGVELVRELRDLRYVDATTLQPDNWLYMFHYPIVRGAGWPPPIDERTGAPMFHAVQQAILGNEPVASAQGRERPRRPRRADRLPFPDQQLDPRHQRPAWRPRPAGGRPLLALLGGRHQLHGHAGVRERRARQLHLDAHPPCQALRGDVRLLCLGRPGAHPLPLTLPAQRADAGGSGADAGRGTAGDPARRLLRGGLQTRAAGVLRLRAARAAHRAPTPPASARTWRCSPRSRNGFRDESPVLSGSVLPSQQV